MRVKTPSSRWLRDSIGGREQALIIGNPPFSLAEEHVALAMSRLSTRPSHLCFLLRASFLAGKGRVAALFDGPESIGGLRYVWHVVGRPGFTPDGKTDSAEYAVLTWEAGYRGDYSGGWLRWRSSSELTLRSGSGRVRA